ncbi:tyrosine-type recombinase/integrase [Clostridium beijerinckii]|uniref:Tyrosine-type recombinase/integrase n=1 Tax=Clostridium beijerinckii TaxID=1520 RepID=A0AAW3WDH6_CLOBE|nr:tyrosine-type recombinase/integrase [Clostridium beijerinckii]MBC2476907.1 tyrosine-type recombinase/integrase [Clostridium beijerinckii]
MKTVKAILDDEKIKEIEDYLKNENERDYILFLCGITLGLRISDILSLRVGDIVNKDNIYITEKKTGKSKEIAISKKLKNAIKIYCKDADKKDYLIKSRQGINKPIGRDRAYRIIRNVAELFGLDRIGTHSLRKSFGRKYYQKYEDIEGLRKYFNHSTVSVTRSYIGLEQEIINKNVKELWD